MQKKKYFSFHFRVQSKFDEVKITKKKGNIWLDCSFFNVHEALLKIKKHSKLENVSFSD